MTRKEFWRECFLRAIAGAADSQYLPQETVEDAADIADAAVEEAEKRSMLAGREMTEP